MGKFKVGDRVRVFTHFYGGISGNGVGYIVEYKPGIGERTYKVDVEDFRHQGVTIAGWYKESELILVYSSGTCKFRIGDKVTENGLSGVVVQTIHNYPSGPHYMVKFDNSVYSTLRSEDQLTLTDLSISTEAQPSDEAKNAVMEAELRNLTLSELLRVVQRGAMAKKLIEVASQKASQLEDQ